MGTSHRQAPVTRCWWPQIRAGLRELFSLPDGYEVALGNGGTTAFWDAAACCLVRRARAPPRLRRVLLEVRRVHPQGAVPRGPDRDRGRRPATRPSRGRDPDADVIAWAHNETSTGVMVPVARPAGAERRARADRRDLGRGRACRSTSAQTDAYYFAPQKGLGSDGGPVAGAAEPASARADRADRRRIRGDGRWIPDFLSLQIAHENSVKDQTYNTPAIATLLLLADQLEWMLERGGLEAMVARTTASSSHLYGWAEEHEHATPFVGDPAKRSLVVGTIDFDAEVDAADLASTLRANGIVDVEPYRKLGRNQLRVGDVPGDRSRRRAGADGLHRLGPGAAVMTAAVGLERPAGALAVLVAEKIGDSGIDLLREHFDVDARRRLVARGARGADRRVRRHPDPLGDQARRPADRAGGRGCARSAGPGVGVDNVDVEAATKRGIIVANAPQSNVITAAEHTMALLLALARNVPQAHASLTGGAVGALASSPASSCTRRRSGSSGSGGSASSWPSARGRSACDVIAYRPVRRRRSATGGSASRRPSPPTTSTRRPTSSRCTCRTRPTRRAGSTPRRSRSARTACGS